MPTAPDARLLSKLAGWWLVVTAGLHLVWEVAQLPLYTIWTRSPPLGLAAAVVHCTLGDILISAAIYAAVAVAWRRVDWIRTSRRTPFSVALVLGMVYTAWSEWRNVYVAGNWSYVADMPTVSGIGVAPLVQWIVVPIVSWVLIRRRGPSA